VCFGLRAIVEHNCYNCLTARMNTAVGDPVNIAVWSMVESA
jgi:hypothetical protein